MKYLVALVVVLLSLVVPVVAQEPEGAQEAARISPDGYDLDGYTYEYVDSRYEPEFDTVRDGKINVQDIMAVASRWGGEADVSAHDRIKVLGYWISTDPWGRGRIRGFVENGTPFSLEDIDVVVRLFDSDGQLVLSDVGEVHIYPIPAYSRSIFTIGLDDPFPEYDSIEVLVKDVRVSDVPIELTVLSLVYDGSWRSDGVVRNDMQYPIEYPGYIYYELDDDGRPVDGGWLNSVYGYADQENHVMYPGETGTFWVGGDPAHVIFLFRGSVYLDDHLN